MDLSIIIPYLNESDSTHKLVGELRPVVEELARTQAVELVFVDDGSTDGTEATLRQLLAGDPWPLHALKFERHPVNRGLGAALRTGFAAATGEVIVTTDFDGTYHFTEIPRLLSYLTEKVDMVTASPYHPQGGVDGVPAYRLMLSRGSSAIYRVLVGWQLHTYTALFRAYRRAVVEHVSFTANGFLGGTELMVKAILLGYRVAEYPTVLYTRSYGASKAKIMRTIRAHLGFQTRVALHRLNIAPLQSSAVRSGIVGSSR